MRTYEGRLPADINAHRRLDLIAQYRSFMGETYMPSRLPDALKWTTVPAIFNSKGECVDVTSWLDSHCPPIDWMVVDAKEGKSLPVKETQSEFLPFKKVRKAAAIAADEVNLAVQTNTGNGLGSVKRPRIEVPVPQDDERYGASWHENSCAYDCIATFCVWLNQEHSSFASRALAWNNDILRVLVSIIVNERPSVDVIRDKLRANLTLSNPREFVHGAYASVLSILECITRSEDIALTSYIHCTCSKSKTVVKYKELLVSTASQGCDSLTSWFKRAVATMHAPCKACGNMKTQSTTVRTVSPFLAFQIHGGSSISMHFQATTQRSAAQYELKGIIYFGLSHFTMRLIEQGVRVYKYDGMVQTGKIKYESYVSDVKDWMHMDGRDAAVAIYTSSA